MYKGRKIVQSKKVTIDGINFKSMLEGTMHKLLKEAGIKNKYEGVTHVTFDGFKYGGECYERVQKRSEEMVNKQTVSKVSYTIDFVGEDEKWFIEVKGRANESFSIRWKLFKKLLNTREKPPMIFKPTNVTDCKQVIAILKQKGYGKK
jgi:hypothetical protein